jgi:succinate dehydrogenase hydrophobic anchor subunit
LPARKRISRKHGTRNWLAMRGSAACAIDNCGRFATCPVH